MILIVTYWASTQINNPNLDLFNSPKPASEIEILGLIKFYKMFNGDAWTINTNWLMDDPCLVGYLIINYKRLILYIISIY